MKLGKVPINENTGRDRDKYEMMMDQKKKKKTVVEIESEKTVRHQPNSSSSLLHAEVARNSQ
jgi:hypothetical protein